MAFLDILFPKFCLECKKVDSYICSDCISRVRLLKPACPYCEKASIDGFTHVKCRNKYGLNGLISIWKYEGVIKKAIYSLKYKYATEIMREICGNFMPRLDNLGVKNIISDDYCVMPIPTHWYRQNYRGFNQSEELGKVVAREMGWNFEPKLLIRAKLVKPQVGLSVKDRKNNLNGVFSLSLHNSSFRIPNSIVLFDDVFTTGSTLKEACKVLKRNGVKKVWGMTLAR